MLCYHRSHLCHSGIRESVNLSFSGWTIFDLDHVCGSFYAWWTFTTKRLPVSLLALVNWWQSIRKSCLRISLKGEADKSFVGNRKFKLLMRRVASRVWCVLSRGKKKASRFFDHINYSYNACIWDHIGEILLEACL